MCVCLFVSLRCVECDLNSTNACNSGTEATHVEWSKIQTPTDEVVVPYDTLAPTPEGSNILILNF